MNATAYIGNAEELHDQLLETLTEWRGFPALKSGMKAFAGTDVFVVGGVLRDLFSAVEYRAKDFDFLVNGPQAGEFLKWLGDRGTLARGPFGSPRWWPQGEESIYADVIPISGFYNGLWCCKDIIDALNQFDFTANAIALDLRTRQLFDPQHGVRDCRERIVRAVRFDYPDEIISPDCPLSRLSVLWIRLVHYASVLGFEIEPVTRNWLQEHAHFRSDVDTFSRLFFPPAVDRIK